MPYTYDREKHQYTDNDSGKPVSWSSLSASLLRYEDAQKNRVSLISERLASGEYTLERWNNEMRRAIKDNYIAQYLLGRGGRNAMTQSDWGRVGGLLSNQYRYLDIFAQDISSGLLTSNQISSRSGLYIDSATQAYERARAASRLLVLPAYPGDGTTICMANDKCSWSIVEFENRWEATWTLSPAEHCETCLQRSREWAPLVIYK